MRLALRDWDRSVPGSAWIGDEDSVGSPTATFLRVAATIPSVTKPKFIFLGVADGGPGESILAARALNQTQAAEKPARIPSVSWGLDHIRLDSMPVYIVSARG